MSKNPYREPGPVEPEPRPTRRERTTAWWTKHKPAVLAVLLSVGLLAVVGITALLLMVAAASYDERTRAEQAAAAAQKKSFADAATERAKAAEAWMRANGIEGRATCYADVPRCDVIPKDVRAPFKINCRADDGVCVLE